MKEKLKKSMAIIIITTMLISLSSLFITKKSSAATLTTTCRHIGKWLDAYASSSVGNLDPSKWAKENGVDISKINKDKILNFEKATGTLGVGGLISFSNNEIDLDDVKNFQTITEELKAIISGEEELKEGEFIYDNLKQIGLNVDNMIITSTVKADGNTYELSTLNHNYNMKELTEIFNGDYIGNNSKIEFNTPVEITIKASSDITVNVKSISFDNEKVTVVKADDNSEQTIENVKEIMVSGETTTKDFSVIKDNQKLNIVGDCKKSLYMIEYNHEEVSKEWTILYQSWVTGAVAFDDMTFNITDGDGVLWYLVLATDKNIYLVKADEFKNFATTLNYTAKIDNNDVGGTTDKDGTFSPNYNSEDIKKDADVTATIKSTNGDDIVVVNNKKLDETGKANEDGWYYPDVNDKTTIVKIYPFERYNNSTDNGIVKESVELQNKNGDKSEQNVSITWPFRIIDKTYDPDVIDKNTNEVKVTITTNLPMDPNKVPDGWTIVPDTDNHKITKTYKRGQDINEDVTVYQNGTGKTDSTTVTVKWNGETAPTILARTGESKLLIGIIAILIVVAVIIKIKRNRLK